MSVYVGIDAHRKRSQVAVVAEDGQVQLNRKRGERLRAVPAADRRPTFRDPGSVRGRIRLELAGRAAGGPRLRPAHGAPAAVQDDRLGPAEKRQGPARRSWRSCCARTCCRRPGTPPRRCASSARWCGTGSAWSASVPSCGTGSTRSPPTTAMTGPPATGPGRAAAGWPSWTCPRHDPSVFVADVGRPGTTLPPG